MLNELSCAVIVCVCLVMTLQYTPVNTVQVYTLGIEYKMFYIAQLFNIE